MYHFVVHNPKGRSKPKSSTSADRRRAELQDSDARAHAAKIAFLKKKAREERAKQSTSASVSTRKQSAGTVATESGEVYEAWTDVVDDNRSKPASSSSDSDSGTEVSGAASKALQVNNKRNALVFVEGRRKPLQTIFHIEPYSLLSQSRRDPFDAYPHRRLPDYIQNVVNHGQFTSPPMFPSSMT
jgi:hypothetical protein